MEISVERDNKIVINFKNNTRLEVVDNSESLDEIALWFINKKGEIINLCQG